MSAGVSPSDLVHRYATSIVEANIENFKSCLAEDAVGKLQRNNDGTQIFKGESFVSMMQKNHFGPHVKAHEIARDVFEEKGHWVCKLESEQTKSFGSQQFTGDVSDTITLTLAQKDGVWKVQEVFHHFRPTIDGKNYNFCQNEDGSVTINWLD